MKNLLFIAYHFPPSLDSGSFRPFKMAKYLKKNGNWNPIVLTIDPKFEEERTYDFNYEKEVVDSFELHKVNSLIPLSTSDELYKQLFYEVQFPERQVGALRHFLLKSLEVINNQKIDAIFCTCPPFSMGLVGVLLKEITGIPLVIDFRDGWIKGNELFNKIRSQEGFMINSYFEKMLVEKSDVFITVEDALGETITKGLNKKHITITNGFDLQDFGEINEEYQIENNEIELVWCGRIYSKYEPYLLKLCDAIKSLNDNRDYKVNFTILGDIFQNKNFENELKMYGFINYIGRVSNEEAIKYCKNAHINVVIDLLSTSIGSKVYNLLPANRPIFMLCNFENKFSKNLLNDYSEKKVLDIEVAQCEIETELNNYIQSLFKVKTIKNSIDKYSEYNREKQAKVLETYLYEIIRD